MEQSAGSTKAAPLAASAPAPFAASGPGIANALTSVVYLHADHLGSISTVTDQGGNVVSSQQYDPWGKVRSGGVGQTKLNYTGQRKDDTGLLYYHARYYDPSVARFVSADSIVPGAGSGVGGAMGSVGGWQHSLLTTDFHENGFVRSVNEENYSGLNKTRRSQAFWGPGNPQALNRYAYVLNNPVRYTDPTGHCVDGSCAGNNSTLQPGPYAKESIPARSPSSRLNTADRREMQRIGNTHGCHTCGTKEPGTKSGNWVADHQPSTARNPNNQPQQLYPHCASCSARQGHEVQKSNAANNAANANAKSNSPMASQGNGPSNTGYDNPSGYRHGFNRGYGFGDGAGGGGGHEGHDTK